MISTLLLAFSLKVAFSAIPDNFDVVTNYGGESIGWIKVYECVESSSSTFSYSNGQSPVDFTEYFQHAIAVQFLESSQTPADVNFESPTDQFAVMADVCSNPVIALNNNLDLSWPIDPASLQNTGAAASASYVNAEWRGTSAALARLVQGDATCDCPAQDPQPIYDAAEDGLFLYWACCNHAGVHITRGQCSLDYQDDLAGIEGVSFWLGFSQRNKCCQVEGGDGVLTRQGCGLEVEVERDLCSYSLSTFVEECYCGADEAEAFAFGVGDNLVKIELPVSVFYVLAAFIVAGVVALFASCGLVAKKLLQPRNGKVKFQKVLDVDTEDERMVLQ